MCHNIISQGKPLRVSLPTAGIIYINLTNTTKYAIIIHVVNSIHNKMHIMLYNKRKEFTIMKKILMTLMILICSFAMSIAYAEDSITIGEKNITVNFGDNQENAVVIVAKYDENNKFESVSLYPKTSSTTTIPSDTAFGKIKVMVWNGIGTDGLKPICKTADNFTSPTPTPTPTPYPIQSVVKIMPLGDSITNGFSVAGAYRNQLCNLLAANNLSSYVDFVGSQKTGTGYDNDNEGHSGWAIAAIPASGDIEGKGRKGLTTDIDNWMKTYSPDIVLLQIGTNDILSLYDLNNAPARLETLVNKVLAKLPERGTLYIAKIPYIAENAAYNKTGKSQAELNAIVDTYNNSVAALAEKKGLTLVDINGCITLSDLKDGIHPTAAGYAKMGSLWYNTLEREIRTRTGN